MYLLTIYRPTATGFNKLDGQFWCPSERVAIRRASMYEADGCTCNIKLVE